MSYSWRLQWMSRMTCIIVTSERLLERLLYSVIEAGQRLRHHRLRGLVYGVD